MTHPTGPRDGAGDVVIMRGAYIGRVEDHQGAVTEHSAGGGGRSLVPRIAHAPIELSRIAPIGHGVPAPAASAR